MSYHLLEQESTAFSPWQVVIHPSIHPFICPSYLPYHYLSLHLSIYPPIHPPNVPLSLPFIYSSSIHIYSFLFLSFSHSVIYILSIHTSPPFIFPHNSKRPFFPSIHPLTLLSTHEPFHHSSFYPTILSSFFHYFIHFSFHPFIHLSLHPSIYPSIPPSSFIFQVSLISINYFISFLLFPFHLFIYPLIFPSFHFPSIIFCPHFLIFICPPIHPSLHLFFHTCFHLFILLSFVHSSMFFPFISSSYSNKVSVNVECLLCA